ncbi:MAG: hypothetical protein EBU46_18945 [Nitrosomonadaceae bacterium]|nr:hypothetical protein [Nitrosomonadaceae bacterium]
MNPAGIIAQAAAEGVILALAPTGAIKTTGEQTVVDKWLPVIRNWRENASPCLWKTIKPIPLSWQLASVTWLLSSWQYLNAPTTASHYWNSSISIMEKKMPILENDCFVISCQRSMPGTRKFATGPPRSARLRKSIQTDSGFAWIKHFSK